MQGVKGSGLRNKLAVCSNCGVERRICKVNPPTCYTCYDKLRYKEGRLRSEREKERKKQYYIEHREYLKQRARERYAKDPDYQRRRRMAKQLDPNYSPSPRKKKEVKVDKEQVLNDQAEAMKIDCPVCNGKWKTHTLCAMVKEARDNLNDDGGRDVLSPPPSVE